MSEKGWFRTRARKWVDCWDSKFRATASICVRRQKNLVDIECARATEHFFRRAVRVGFGERLTPCPGDKVLHRSPPSLNLVVPLCVRVVDECSGVVVESNRARAMNFVADESGRLVHEVDPIAETIFEIDLVSSGYWNAIRYDNHRSALQT